MNKEKLELRRKAREEQKELARIEREKNQKPVSEITITIEWKKSYTWGHNPNCEASVKFKDGLYEHSPVFKASGCGYDKESTVIADVFNHYLKYKLWEFSVLKEWHTDEYKKKIPYGISLASEKYKYVHYAGAIGTSCYKAISEFIGGKFETISSGKTFDVYKFTMN